MSVTIEEVVVLLGEDGRARGTAPKATVHQSSTPLHLAFSCYLFDPDDRLLLTRRALDKRTFPGLWTNSVCGHPAPGESGSVAAVRRVRAELGASVDAPRLVLPEFRYRASQDGIEEHEWCPVYVGQLAPGQALAPDPTEIAGVRWVPWAEVARSVLDGSADLSPWSLAQIRELNALGAGPAAWPSADPARLPAALRSS